MKILEAKILQVKIKYIIIIAICVIFSALFIFDHLGARSLWVDEAVVANITVYPFALIYQKAIADVQPLFYIYLLKIWSLIFGHSEFALRNFSALFALLLPILFYKAGSYIFKNKKVGIIAAILAATNYFLIWFGTQARPYTLATCLSLLSFYFLIRTEREGKKRDYLFYILLTVLGIYTHIWFFFIFGAQILLVLFLLFAQNRVKLLKILIAQILITLMAVPNMIITFAQIKIGSNVWIAKPKISILGQSFHYFVFGSVYPYLTFALLALAYLILSRAKIKITQQHKINYLALGLYLVFPLLFAFTLSQFKPAYVAGRYEITILPAFILLCASLFAQIKNKIILCLILPVLIGFTGDKVIQDRNLVASYGSQDRTIAQDLLCEAKTGDTIITTDLAWATFAYYLNRQKGAAQKFNLLSFPQEIIEHPAWKNLDQMLSQKEKYNQEAEILIQKLKTQSAPGCKIYLLDKNDNPLNEILRQKLQVNFDLLKTEAPATPRPPSWWDVILIFEIR